VDVVRRGRNAVLQLIVRTFLMRGISVLGTIVLARLLMPADFGVFAVLVLWIAVLTQLGEFGLGASLVQQAHDPTPDELSTVWVTQQLIWIPVVAVVWLLAPLVTQAFPGLGSDFEWQLRAISLTLVLSGFRAVPSAMLSRELRFGALSAAEVSQHLAFYSVAVVLAISGFGSWSFVVAVLAQWLLGTILVNLAWRRFPGFRFRPQIARRQLRFGATYQASTLIGVSSTAVISVFGGLAGGVAAIGQLQFASRVGQLAAFFDEIIGRVTFPAFSRLQHDPERLGRVVRDSILVAMLGVAATQGWVIAVANSLVPQVFGQQWTPAIGALQLLCLGTMAMIPLRFLRSLLLGLGRGREALLLIAATVAVLFIAFPFCVLAFGIPGGGLAFVLASTSGLTLHARAVRRDVPPLWGALVRILLLVLPPALAAWLVSEWLPGFLGLVVSGLLFLAIDAALLFTFARADLERAWRLVAGSRGSGPPAASDEDAAAEAAAVPFPGHELAASQWPDEVPPAPDALPRQPSQERAATSGT
jgi:O-antigen/teichoic acid export membrane protein